MRVPEGPVLFSLVVNRVLPPDLYLFGMLRSLKGNSKMPRENPKDFFDPPFPPRPHAAGAEVQNRSEAPPLCLTFAP